MQQILLHMRWCFMQAGEILIQNRQIWVEVRHLKGLRLTPAV